MAPTYPIPRRPSGRLQIRPNDKQAGEGEISAATERALSRIKTFRPYTVKTPVRLDLRFKSYRQADLLSYLPIIERLDSHTVRSVGKDLPAASKFLEFVMQYESDVDP